jgi:hypothetical protein
MLMRITALLIGLITLLVLVFPDFATATIGVATAWFIQKLGLSVLWLSSLFLLLCVFLVLAPGATSDWAVNWSGRNLPRSPGCRCCLLPAWAPDWCFGGWQNR